MSISVRAWVYSSMSSASVSTASWRLDVEAFDAPLLPAVEVDRTGVCDLEDARVVGRADEGAVAADQAVLDRRSGAESDVGRGRIAPGPVHAAVAGLEPVVEREPEDGIVEAGAEPAFVVELQGQLVGRARDLGVEDERVLRVHHRRFGTAAEELGGVRGVPLVELVVAGDEHGRCAAACPRPARPTCCQSDASVPGKPLSTTVSSAPTSIPSSRAFVAAIPSSVPSDNARSSSRRSRGDSRPGTTRPARLRLASVRASMSRGVGRDELGAAPANG